MKVQEIMTSNTVACPATASLAEAAMLMWDNDCGVLPVVAGDGKVVGLITDRDICMAAATKGLTLSNIAVEETSSGRVYSCRPNDDVREGLATMKEQRVRRLVVVDADGKPEGVLSINDIVLNAVEQKNNKRLPTYSEVIETFQAICAHPKRQEKQRTAGA
jgi:CBS domain-containing protein